MRLFRWLKKSLRALVVGTCVFLLGGVTAVQVEQYIFRSRTERLLGELRSLDLRVTPWPLALAKFQHWGKKREFDRLCNEQACSITIKMSDPAYGFVSDRNIFVRLDDYIRWRLRLSYSTGLFEELLWSSFRGYMLAGGHPAEVEAKVSMREGVVWGKAINIRIETYAKDGAWRGSDGGRVEYTLLASAHSVPRLNWFDALPNHGQWALHPEYQIGRPDGCEICVFAWAEFTPYAAPQDVDRLMRIDTSCLTRWHSCLTEKDILPEAWARYTADRAKPAARRCPEQVLRWVGRDSDHIVLGELLEYHDGIGRIRVLDRLKGATGWKVGEIRDVRIVTEDDRQILRLPLRSHVLLIAGWGPLRGMRVDAGYGCPTMIMDEAKLAEVRRGVELDYTSDSPSQYPPGSVFPVSHGN